MNHVELLTAVFEAVASIANIPPVLYPNISYETQTDDYITVNVMPAEPDNIGVSAITRYRGIIQINVYVKQGTSELTAAGYAQRIVDAFPRGTTLTSGTTSIRIDEQPSIYAGMKDGAFWMMPVRVIYNKLC